jgi:hypothetical protein
MHPKRWRVALIDSGCDAPGVSPTAALRFRLAADGVQREAAVADPSGHGSRVGAIIAAAVPAPEMLLAQVFADNAATSAAVVAAAVNWAAGAGAQLLHLSLGLRADRPVLREAIGAALAAGCVVVAAAPARGELSYPAAYPGVLRATGDARCAPGELSALDAAAPLFGGCVRPPQGAPGGGASIGAAFVTRAILDAGPVAGAGLPELVAALVRRAAYRGPERRG